MEKNVLSIILITIILFSVNFASAQIPTAPNTPPEDRPVGMDDKPAIVFNFYDSSETCKWEEDYAGWDSLKCNPIEGVEVLVYDEKSQTLLTSDVTNESGEVFFYSDELPEQFSVYYKKEGYYTDKEPNKFVNGYTDIRYITNTLIKYANGFGNAQVTLYDTKTNRPLKIKEDYLKGRGIAYVYLYDVNGNFVGQRDLTGEEEPNAIFDKLPIGTYEYYASVSGYDDSPKTTIEITNDQTTESKAFLKKYEKSRFLRFLNKIFGFFKK